jgi:hypothetical protein
MIKPTAHVFLASSFFFFSSIAATIFAEDAGANSHVLSTAPLQLRGAAASAGARNLEDMPMWCYDLGSSGVNDPRSCSTSDCGVDYACLTNAAVVGDGDFDLARFSCQFTSGFVITKTNDPGCEWKYSCCDRLGDDA